MAEHLPSWFNWCLLKDYTSLWLSGNSSVTINITTTNWYDFNATNSYDRRFSASLTCQLMKDYRYLWNIYWIIHTFAQHHNPLILAPMNVWTLNSEHTGENKRCHPIYLTYISGGFGLSILSKHLKPENWSTKFVLSWNV